MKIKCEMCGKHFIPGMRSDGLPTGVGFQTEDGKNINVCTPCILKIGESEEAQKEFKERFGVK